MASDDLAAGPLLLEIARGLDAVDLSTVGHDRIRDRVVSLAAGATAISAQLLRLIAHLDSCDGTAATGAASTQAWLRDATGMSARAAGRTVRTATGVAKLPSVHQAMMTGAVRSDHADVIVDTLADLPADVSAAERDEAVDVLVADARRLDATALARLGQQVRHVIDPGSLDRDATRQHADRTITCVSSPGGVHLRGLLPVGTGQVLVGALNALSAPQAAGPDGPDRRTAGQRRADALIELARRAAQSGRLPTSGGVRPQVSLLIPWDGLAGRPSLAATSLTGDVIAPSDALRHSCDALVTRVGVRPVEGSTLAAIVSAPSLPLDVGRATRTIPTGIRTALVVRDRGCRFPGCSRPAAWCEAHHNVHWARGGATSMDNLLLLCGHHHDVVHETGMVIPILPTEEPQDRPTMIVPTPSPDVSSGSGPTCTDPPREPPDTPPGSS